MNTKQLLSLLAALGVVVFFLGVGNSSVYAKLSISPRGLVAPQDTTCDVSSSDEDDVETQVADLGEFDEADLEGQINLLKANLEKQEQKIVVSEKELAELNEKVKNLEKALLDFETNKKTSTRKELLLKLMDLIKCLGSMGMIYSAVMTVSMPLGFNLEMIFNSLVKVAQAARDTSAIVLILYIVSLFKRSSHDNDGYVSTPRSSSYLSIT